MGLCFWFLSPSKESERIYQNLMNVNNQSRLKGESKKTEQIRYQVSKQILYEKENERLQSHLFSEHSEITFDPGNPETELVEHFKGLKCAIQEKLISCDEKVQQSIRTFDASQAVYSYKTNLLKAKNVEMGNFLMPGSHLPSSFDSYPALIEGRAHSIELSFKEKPSLKAQGFHAIFDNNSQPTP